MPDNQSKNRHTHLLSSVLIAFSRQQWLTEAHQWYVTVHCFVYNRDGACLPRGTSCILIQIRVNLSV